MQNKIYVYMFKICSPEFSHVFVVTESQLADLNNVGKTGAGGSCSAAAFLKVT